MYSVPRQELKDSIVKGCLLIDVRAPIEFALGTLPGAINLPIMDDAQRAAVGTAYKISGREEALRLGHQLISGEVKESRLRDWAQAIGAHPEAILFCFRGGLRSRIAQAWLADIGIHCPLVEGGYKRGRQTLRESLDFFVTSRDLLVLSGPTGSAKTQVLNQAALFSPTLDLEALAHHRGSAFGAMAEPQPTQINFENEIAKKTLQICGLAARSPLLVEDESRLIGRCAIPENLFLRMRSSNVLYLEEPFDQRVENIFQDYILSTPIGRSDSRAAREQFARFKKSIQSISRKLGGARAQEITRDLADCENKYLHDFTDLACNRGWVAKLLNYYYDPAYSQSLKKRDPTILIRGRAATVLSYLKAAD